MENLIDIGGVIYTLDLEVYSKLLVICDDEKGVETETKTDYDTTGKPIGTTVTSREYDRVTDIDGPKYDVVRMCLEILLTFQDEFDDELGIERALAKTPISFKLAFNTLLSYGILKEEEGEGED